MSTCLQWLCGLKTKGVRGIASSSSGHRAQRRLSASSTSRSSQLLQPHRLLKFPSCLWKSLFLASRDVVGEGEGPGLMLAPPLSSGYNRVDSAFCPLLRQCSLKIPVLASCISLGQFLISKMGTIPISQADGTIKGSTM